MNAFEAAEKNGRAADLQKELEDLFTSQNTSGESEHDVNSCHVPARDRRSLAALQAALSAATRRLIVCWLRGGHEHGAESGGLV